MRSGRTMRTLCGRDDCCRPAPRGSDPARGRSRHGRRSGLSRIRCHGYDRGRTCLASRADDVAPLALGVRRVAIPACQSAGDVRLRRHRGDHRLPGRCGTRALVGFREASRRCPPRLREPDHGDHGTGATLRSGAAGSARRIRIARSHEPWERSTLSAVRRIRAGSARAGPCCIRRYDCPPATWPGEPVRRRALERAPGRRAGRSRSHRDHRDRPCGPD